MSMKITTIPHFNKNRMLSCMIEAELDLIAVPLDTVRDPEVVQPILRGRNPAPPVFLLTGHELLGVHMVLVPGISAEGVETQLHAVMPALELNFELVAADLSADRDVEEPGKLMDACLLGPHPCSTGFVRVFLNVPVSRRASEELL